MRWNGFKRNERKSKIDNVRISVRIKAQNENKYKL